MSLAARWDTNVPFDKQFSVSSIQRDPMAVPTYGKGGQGKEPMGGPYSARRTEPSPSIEWAAHYPVPPRSVRLVQTRFSVSNSVEQTPVEKVEQAPAYSRPALASAEGPIREVWWCRNSDRTHPARQDPLSRTAATLNSPASGRVFFEPMLVQRSPRTVAQAGGAPDRFATKTAEVTRPRLQNPVSTQGLGMGSDGEIIDSLLLAHTQTSRTSNGPHPRTTSEVVVSYREPLEGGEDQGVGAIGLRGTGVTAKLGGPIAEHCEALPSGRPSRPEFALRKCDLQSTLNNAEYVAMCRRVPDFLPKEHHGRRTSRSLHMHINSSIHP